MSVQTYEPTDLSAFEGSHVGRWVSILAPAAALSERIAGTEFVPSQMRGKPDVVCAAIMYGDELGLGPMQALQGIHVVEGRPAPSAELMRALIYRAGHRIDVIALTGEVCTLRGIRAGATSGVEVTWTIGMAQSAGLLSRNNWRNYPRAMLLARASSELARIAFPDVVKGLGHLADDEETATEVETWATNVATEPTPPQTTTIRRRTAKALPSVVPGPVEDVALPIPAPDEDFGPPPDLPLPSGPPSDAPDRPVPSGPPSGDGETSPVHSPSPGDVPVGGVLPIPDIDVDRSPPIGSQLMKAVHAGFHRIDCDDRNLRLRITMAIIGRHITSSNELTRHEALNLVRVLSDLETGLATMSIDPEGNVEILATEPEE